MSQISQGNILKIEKFTGSNFAHSKLQIEDYLVSKDLYATLLGEKPKYVKQAKWDLLDRKALATIRLSFAASIVVNIKSEKTTKGVIDALEKMYKRASGSRKAYLMKKLFTMKMAEGGSIASHVSEFNTITDQLEARMRRIPYNKRAL